MYRVAIIGAGIGGSYLSWLLSEKGVDTIIFDFRAPHEKLCGGGVSYKTVAKFPIIDELCCARKTIWKTTFISPKDRTVTIEFKKPLAIFHRMDLDYSFLKKALESGANFRKERVQSFILERNHWRIFTETSDYRAEILIGADGALSGMRRKLRLPPKKRDYFLAFECFLDMQQEFVINKFFPDLVGYLWVFPRVNSLAVGIVSRHFGRKHVQDVQKKLLYFIERNYPGQTKRISLRGAYIPFFSTNEIQDMSICSKNWALIGDAASFVDPISGEGIYYAIYSADILASCIIEGRLPDYQRLCMKYFGKNLLEASQSFECFYSSKFIETIVALAEKSQSVKKIISEMITGDIDYLSLKWKFVKYWVRLFSMLG